MSPTERRSYRRKYLSNASPALTTPALGYKVRSLPGLSTKSSKAPRTSLFSCQPWFNWSISPCTCWDVGFYFSTARQEIVKRRLTHFPVCPYSSRGWVDLSPRQAWKSRILSHTSKGSSACPLLESEALGYISRGWELTWHLPGIRKWQRREANGRALKNHL